MSGREDSSPPTSEQLVASTARPFTVRPGPMTRPSPRPPAKLKPVQPSVRAQASRQALAESVWSVAMISPTSCRFAMPGPTSSYASAAMAPTALIVIAPAATVAMSLFRKTVILQVSPLWPPDPGSQALSRPASPLTCGQLQAACFGSQAGPALAMHASPCGLLQDGHLSAPSAPRGFDRLACGALSCFAERDKCARQAENGESGTLKAKRAALLPPAWLTFRPYTGIEPASAPRFCRIQIIGGAGRKRQIPRSAGAARVTDRGACLSNPCPCG